jgi:predicted short-subunit dehydrogenase-like oxidoreductase (DUF2520 family)
MERVVREDLDGTAVFIEEDDRPLWHAAAVSVSNGTAALMAMGEALLRSIGIERPELVLGPLAAGTVANAIEEGGGGATLTGPVVRGDVGTVERHVRALSGGAPEVVDSYRQVARLIADAAARTGRLSPTGRRLLNDVLNER